MHAASTLSPSKTGLYGRVRGVHTSPGLEHITTIDAPKLHVSLLIEKCFSLNAFCAGEVTVGINVMETSWARARSIFSIVAGSITITSSLSMCSCRKSCRVVGLEKAWRRNRARFREGAAGKAGLLGETARTLGTGARINSLQDTVRSASSCSPLVPRTCSVFPHGGRQRQWARSVLYFHF